MKKFSVKSFFKDKNKAIITYGGVLVIVIAMVVLWGCFGASSDESYDDDEVSYSDSVSDSDSSESVSYSDYSYTVERVRVIELVKTVETDVQSTQIFMVEILTGEYKGQTAAMTLDITDLTGTGQDVITAEVGDMLRGYFEIDSSTGALVGVCTGFQRDVSMLWIVIIFALLLLLFFGRKGIRSFLSLAITCGILIVMIASMYNGMIPMLAVAIFGISVIIVNLLIIYGPSKSSLAAGCGAMVGIAAAAIVSHAAGNAMWITGTVEEYSVSLIYTNNASVLDASSIALAVIITCCIGGILQVGVETSNSINAAVNSGESFGNGWELVRYGLSTGWRCMSTTLNTLVIAYVGCSFQMLMLYAAYYGGSLTEAINNEVITVEILRLLVACMALLITIPATALIAALFVSKGKMGRFDIKSVKFIGKASAICDKIDEVWDNAVKKADEKARLKSEENAPPAVQNLFERAKEHYAEMNPKENPTDDGAAQDAAVSTNKNDTESDIQTKPSDAKVKAPESTKSKNRSKKSGKSNRRR